MENKRPAFSFLICPDSQIIKHEVERLLATYPPSVGTWQKRVYWGDEEPPSKFWEIS